MSRAILPAATTDHDRGVLAADRAGDQRAFERLTAPLQRELHVHCYRMLGTVQDADDALQDTLLRAWRQLGGFQPRQPLRAWLYRIATNVCLSALAGRTRRAEVSLHGFETARAPEVVEGDAVHVDPYPDRLLDRNHAPQQGPEAAVERRETVELAFVVAVQLLPPRQRAVLLLRDVFGFPAAEVADLLGTSVAAVNSALQRARSTCERERRAGRITRVHAPATATVERSLVRRFSAAWQAADVSALVRLLAEDALLTMPPAPLRLVGREAIASFLRTGPGDGHLDRFRAVETYANRQPAIALYLEDPATGVHQAHAVLVLSIRGATVASVTRFGTSELFDRFGLPQTLQP